MAPIIMGSNGTYAFSTRASSIALGDIDKNLEIMENLITEAQDKCDAEIDLIAFPELFITGYNLRDDYNKVAEKIPSQVRPKTELLNLRKNTMFTLTGIVEKVGKTLFKLQS